MAEALRVWRRPVLWGVVSLVVLMAVLDRDLDRVVRSLPEAALGGGLLAAVVALTALSAGSRWPRGIASLIAGVTVGYSIVAWYALKHGGLIHSSVFPWLVVGVGVAGWLVGFNRFAMWSRLVDLVLALLGVAWVILVTTGASLGLQRGIAALLEGGHALEHASIVLLAGVGVFLASRWAPRTAKPVAQPDGRFIDRSLGLTFLLAYPGLTLGGMGVIRAGRRRWLQIILGTLALVPLGIGLTEGLLVLAPLVAALGCWLGWELTPITSSLVAPEGLLGVLPRTRGSYGRRTSVLPALTASAFVLAAILVAWRLSFLVGFGTVAMIALGCGVGFIGAGVALRVMAQDLALAQSRWVSSVLAVAFAGCALAPLVQLNNAFAAHGLFFEYASTGTSFSVIMGVIGISLTSWWKGEIRDS
ncbi:hypothetical protein [Ferrimicrobium sp.]|uniref:hypothetical protein n=1 Tax=Ferrimicrobium sp. TaxID=2926050 RepID=UPI002620896F|nr:hypothetical protein [Ferrimicrobium sp.]